MPSQPKTRPFMRIPVFEQIDSPEFDFNRETQLIDERYRAEDKLLSSIANGDEAQAVEDYYAYGALMQQESQRAHPTSADPLRDFKNSVLVTNTLFRKAIELHVHPIYIHETSSRFGERIELAASEDELIEIIKDMVHVYCQLVRECRLDNYSTVVQRALLYIDMNLSSPITTRDVAKAQFVHPNYLSTVFGREVGHSVSYHILDRRIRLSCQLLLTTGLSIQAVANKVGLPDASYFSKQFKRVEGVSPSAYRKAKGHMR